MAAYSSARNRQPHHGSTVRSYCSNRHPSDVYRYRYRSDRTVRRYLLASAGKCGKRGSGSCSPGCCSEIKGQKSKITCPSVILKCIYGNYRAGHLRCKLEILQTLHRRMYRRRMRSFICIHRTSRSKGDGRNRYLRYPALSGTAGTVSDRNDHRGWRCICYLIPDLS